jgi:exopolysaccharide production protein ExoY
MSDHNLAGSSAQVGLRLRLLPPGLDVWKAVGVGERIFAGVLLALTLPVLLVSAFIIVMLSRRSPLIAHRRVSQGGREIWLLKLRTMWDGRRRNRSSGMIERITDLPGEGPIAKTNRDPRITSVFAGFCRCYSIDELPQLWQVVCGQLALVGPRPITEREIEEYYGPDSAILLSRKPGITGLWQTTGRSRLNHRQRRRLDLFMIRKWSLPLYFLIFARTIHRTPLGKDAW